MVNAYSGARKLGAAIYLKSLAPIKVGEFVSDFQERWPATSCEAEDSEPAVACFKIGHSHIAIEARPTRVPNSLTRSVLETTLHWPSAEKDISAHVAHIAVAASVDEGNTVELASDLTRAVASILAITDSLCVCWANGPALTLRGDFLSIAGSLLRVNQSPFLLWVGVGWVPKGGLLHTKGMAQFGTSELLLGQQSAVSDETVSYLHYLVRNVLTAENTLVEGQTVDGPSGVLKVELLKGAATNKTGLLLLPVKPN